MSAPVHATFTGTARELRGAFLDGLAAAGQGERNVAAHALGVDRFAEYLAPRELDEARPDDLEGFLSYLAELGVSASSLKTYRTVVGRWLDFLAERRGAAEPGGADAAVAAAPRAPARRGPFDPEPVPDEQGNFPTVILDRTPTPRPATFPVFEPEPTTPMMKAVTEAPGAEPATESETGFEPVEPARPAAELLGVEAEEEPGGAAGAFAPPGAGLDAGSDAALDEAADEAADDEPDFEPDFEPVESRGPAFEPADDEPGASEATGFEPVAPDEFETASSGDGAGPDELDAEFSFASAPPAPTPPEAVFDEPEAGASEPEADAGEASSSVFGELPPALGEADGFDAPALDEPTTEAEERDRAKLAAPPLPSLQAAPAPSVPGETEFEGPSGSIPLAGGSAASLDDTGPKNDQTQRGAVPRSRPGPASIDPTNGAMATQPGNGKWGLRRPAGERLDLSLDAIMTLAVSGELEAHHLVRKPSGEWVSASELRPLRRALGLDGGPSTIVRQARAERTLGRAAAGAVVAGLFSGLLWWVTALVFGAELVPLAILGGLLGGFGARMAGQRAGVKIGALGAGAAPLSVLVGRYLVYETLSSGIALEGFQEIGGLGSFLGSGLGTTQVVCLALGALAGLLVGSIGSR